LLIFSILFTESPAESFPYDAAEVFGLLLAPTVEPTERPPYENIDDTEDEEGAEDEDNEDSDSDAKYKPL